MTSFTSKLKELVGKATKGPWEHYGGDWLISFSGKEIAQFFYRDETDFPNRNNNAALIVHLVNHAEDIVALVEALERIKSGRGFEVTTVHDGCDNGGNYKYADVLRLDELQELIEPILSRLDGGKP